MTDNGRRWLFRGLTAVLALLFLELGSAAVLLVLPGPFRGDGPDRLRLDPAYGFAGFRFENPEQGLARTPGPENFRILSFGASTTAGWPYGTELSYTAALAEELGTSRPDLDLEVVNLGVPGFDSREVRRLAEAALAVEPDLVLVYTSQNTVEEYTLKKERLGAFLAVWSPFEGTAAHRLANHLANLAVTALPDWTAVPGDTRGRIFDQPVLDAAARRRLVANYRRNVAAIVRAARQADAHLLLLEPIYHHAAYGPVQSVWSPGTPAVDRRRVETLLEEALELERAGTAAAALGRLEEAIALDAGVAATRFLRARVLARLGRTAEALADRELSAELDGIWAVCPPSYRETLRQVAAADGVPLVELGAEIARRGGPRFLDETWMMDDIHPTPEAHREIGAILHDRLLAEGWLPAPASAVGRGDGAAGEGAAGPRTPRSADPAAGGGNAPSAPPGRIDLEAWFGPERYASWLREVGVHRFHLSLLAFDPEPVLASARSALALHLERTAALGERSFEGEVYAWAAAAESGSTPELGPLVERWGRPALERFVASGHNRYGALDSLARALGAPERAGGEAQGSGDPTGASRRRSAAIL